MTLVRKRSGQLPALVLGVAIAGGVCWPFANGGRLFLLDWVMGPHARVVPQELFGLSGGLTTGLPFTLVMRMLDHVIGAPSTWVPIVAFFPVATVSMSKLVGGGQPARLGAATLFAVNPFVFQRLYAGQIPLLLGYALLPLALLSMVRAVDRTGIGRYAPVLWIALLTAITPHFAWICGVMLLAVAVCHRRRWQALRWAVVVGAGFVVSLAYVILPQLAESATSSGSGSNLVAFQTGGDAQVGLFGNVIGLYGFWRAGPGPVLPKQVESGWFFLLAAIAVIAVAGAVSAMRDPKRQSTDLTGPPRKFVAYVVVVSAAAGFFLALGTQGPTGSLFRWAYYHVPYFAVMREPEKFSALFALGFAACFGWGTELVIARAPAARSPLTLKVTAVAAMALPLAYTPTIFGGLNGQIRTSQIPPGWAAVQRVTAGQTGSILSLPWHLYASYPFSGERVITNPAPTSFTGTVISGTNAQYDGVSTDGALSNNTSPYIESLIAENGGPGDFGALVAPLGVQYVSLAVSFDWSSYGWLGHQSDLRLILRTPSIDLYRNLAYTGLGHRGSRSVERLSPVAYQIPPGTPGWVTVAEPYQKGWKLGTHPAKETAEGMLSVWAGASGGVLRFEPWHWALAGDGLSAVVVLGLAGALAYRRTNPRATAPTSSVSKSDNGERPSSQSETAALAVGADQGLPP